ncbi:retention module-containing protein [Iodobacter fluviatilis]|uniref:VWFA domain-containing protein n=1 Tax=Iodobacter fluviatilis TaxID=537 RepID=A0A7G3G946_9NEIS|nr:retention module-containing protein [Iodobacter fluviatilis]QBC43689.1 hypothetical protein C1H71_09115 [Iodobacter fluviatilis]
MAEQISASKPNVTVVHIDGSVFLRDATGKSVPLKEGQQLNENEIFVTSVDGRVQLLMPNGELLEIGGDRTVQVDAQMLGSAPVDAASAAIADLNASTDKIAAAIASGTDLSTELEATAAGLGGAGGSAEGHSFVELGRIAEGVNPLAFNFAGSDLGTTDLPIVGALPIQPSPNPSILGADTVSVAEDTPASGNVLSNDSDADGPLSVTGFTVAGLPDTFAPNQQATITNVGTLVIAPNGDFTFTPVANYNGPVPVVTYSVVDPVGGTGSSTLTLTVTPVDDPANLQSDVATAAEDTPVTGNVLSNDSDPDGALTVTGFTIAGLTGAFTAGQPASIPNVGTLLIAPSGDYTFTPAGNYNGPVPVITYNVVDPQGGTGSSTLTITITPVDDPANLQADTATLLEDTPATGNVLSNDSDPDGPLTVTGFTIAGLAGTFTTSQPATIPGVGSLVIAPNGDYSFTPENNYNGPVPVITYNVIDPLGGTGSSTLTLTITPVDDPVISTIEVGNPGVADDNVVEGNNLVFNVTLSSATTKVESYAFSLGGGTASTADYGTATFSNGVTYNATTGLITVPAGVTDFAVTLPTVDDALVEITPETVPLTIGGVSATGGILDNDSPTITKVEVGNPGVADDNVVEGNNLVFNVTLSTATTKPETYAFNLGGGSASTADYGTATFSNGVTYNATTGLITVPAGVTGFAVTLPTVDDALVEITPETVPLTIGGVTATGGILDNDSPTITKVEVGNPGVADDNVVEGNNLVFNVTLSTATTKIESYAFNLGGGSASAADYGTATFSNGVTYNATTGLITVPAGVTDFAVTLPTVDDALVEITPEAVPLTIGGVSATGGILDNDSPAITGIEVGNPGVADDNVVEGNNLVFNVTLSTATTKPETYAFNLGGGSASAADYGTATFSNGVTYNATTGLITVPAGVTDFAVTLPTVDDALVEITPEAVPLTIGGVSATGGILDNDSPAITGIEVGNPGVADDNVVEGNNLVFNVTLSTATTKPETYAFNLGGGSASAADYGTATFSNGVTYNATTGLITVPAGVTDFAVTLPTVDDALVEITPEAVPLTIGGVSATGGILDNDSPAITGIEVGNPGVADDNVVEGNNLVFNVTLSTATTKPETYAFNLGGGSASAADYGTATFSNGVTYNATTGLITVPAGVTDFAVTLPTVDDALVEITPEAVPLTIGGVSATGGILDNDSPAITGIEVGNPGVADDNVVEGNNLVFNVTLSTATTKPETYAFNLGGGSASAADYGTATFSNGVTYNATTGLITVPAGVTGFAVTLPTVDDALVEITPETVPLTIGGVSATGGILDNDSPTITKVEVGNPGVADDNVVEGNSLVFNVTLSTATTKIETYAFNLGGGSASAADYGTATFSNGVTYNATTGLITVPAGVTDFAVTLPTVDDALVEITPETVPLTIGGVSATGGILDNDSPAITGIEVGNPGVADDNVVEGNNLVFNVTLSTATTKPETYAFNLGGGSASAADYGTATFSNGVTYNTTTGLITVPAGVTGFAVTLPTVDDALVEITPETVPLTIGGVSATGGILDNDSPTITKVEVGNPGVADDNVVEGNSLVFNVTLSTATTKIESYAFNLGGGSASAADYGTATFSNGVTYNATTGLITVPAGVTDFAVTLPTVDDALVEITPETVPLTIGGVSVTGGILDNDSPAITGIEVGNPGVADDNVVEGNNLVFNVTLSTATTKVESYAFSLGGGSASAADYGTATFSNGVTYNATTGLITVPAGVTGFAVTLPTVDDALVEITPETVPLTIGGVSATGGILDNDVNQAPIIGNASATVSEEGLLGGIKDSTGSPTDTSDSTVRTGTIAISDPGSPVLTTSLIAPTTALSSGGHALVWSGSGTHDLAATAGVGGPVVATINIDNAGNYTVTLKAPIDHPVNSVEDVKSFNVGVKVSDGALSSTGTLTVNVEDDAPVGRSQTANVQIPNVDSNLVLTLDISGSMGDPSGITGKTRLQVAKEAIAKLIDDYDVLGDVKVMLVTFSSSSATQQSGGQTWMSVTEAKAVLAGLVANGGTNYDAAVSQVTTHFSDAGKIVGGQNIGYFFSDGAPNTGLGLDVTEEGAWKSFLQANHINSLALGLGSGVTDVNLNPLAYNGTGAGSETNAIIVTDLAQLPPILRDTIVAPNAGDLTGTVAGVTSGFGADGGHMNDITVDGVKYTFNVAGNSITTAAGAGTYSFDAATHQLKVNTVLGGQFVIDMDDGKYTYTPPVIKTSGSSENIGFTLIDNDGDLDQSNSHLTINVVPPAQGSTLQLSTSTTAIADATRGLHGEFFGYNNDPDKGAGITYNVQSQDNTVGNLDNISDITSVINGRQGSNIVGTQIEASATASDATFIADAVKYGVTPAVTGNLGTNNAVTAGSAITAGNLYNFLGANNAGADTAGLAATSTFGNTTDSIMRMVGGAYFAAGTYDIRVYADDGFRIAVDGLSVFEYNANQPPTTRVQTGVVISEGMHNLEVLYWEQGGNAALKVEFKPTGSADSAYVTLGINDMALFHGTQAPVLTGLQDIIEDPSNNGHYLVRSGQEVTGSNLSDTITGSAGRDIIHGGAGQDVINAGAGADRIEGGGGNDTLTGGLGADTFRWALADKGAVGTPDIDKITDFNSASYNAGGDRLDLRDLLQSENHNVGSGNLTQYLHFEKSGTDTIIHVSSAGSFTGVFNANGDDQRIVLAGVDLTSNGSLADAAIIQDLLNKGKLITD